MTRSLFDLKPDESACVIAVGGDCQLKRRLTAMGVTPGASVMVRKYAPFGDPMVINVRNYSLSIRKKDARHILVDYQPESCDRVKTTEVVRSCI